MRVSCSRCETHYSIPAEKLESGPIKVRCKKCGHVFGVRKKAPRPEVEEAVQPLAHFAAAPTPGEEQTGEQEDKTEEEETGGDLDLGGFGESEEDEQEEKVEGEESGGDLDLGGFGEPEEDEQEDDVDFGNVFAGFGDEDSQKRDDVAAKEAQGEGDMDLSFTQEEASDDIREEDETEGGDDDLGDPIDFSMVGEDDGGEESGEEQEEEDESLDFDLAAFAASTFGGGEEDEGKSEVGDDDELSGTRDFNLGDFAASTLDEKEGASGFDSDTGDDTDAYGGDDETEDPFRQTEPFSADEDGGFFADEKKKGAADEREDEDSLFDRITDDFQPESIGSFGADEEDEDSKFSITSDDDEQEEHGEEDPDAPRLDLRRGSRGGEPPLEYPGVDKKEPKPVFKALVVALLMGTLAFGGYNLLVNPDAAFSLMKVPGINKLLEIPAINKLLGVKTGHKSLKPVEPIEGAYFKRDGKRDLYVISGWIMNKSPEAMSAVEVKGTIFDKAGDKLGESASFLASVLTEPELTAMDDKQIRAKLAKGKLTVLNPGDKEAFMLVFANPPANVAKHKIEVASATKVTNEKDKK